MNAATNFPSQNAKKAIFMAWLLVGTLDICSALTNYYISTGKIPVTVLYYISSAIFGPGIFAAATPAYAVLGLALHYLIAFIWTIIFFKLYPFLPSGLTRFRVITGILYGLVIWTIMSQLVVKLSNAPQGPFNLTNAIVGAAILCVAIGIPLSFLASRYYRGTR